MTHDMMKQKNTADMRVYAEGHLEELNFKSTHYKSCMVPLRIQQWFEKKGS